MLKTPQEPPFPADTQRAMFGMGCFWGVEKRFWKIKGVYTTAVGYAAGLTPNPTYKEVCSGQTGHSGLMTDWREQFSSAHIKSSHVVQLHRIRARKKTLAHVLFTHPIPPFRSPCKFQFHSIHMCQ